MSFVQAVCDTPDIAHCLQKGLQALGTSSAKIHVPQIKALEGSVDIDTCLKNKYPDAPRWDYAFGYQGSVYYVEVHPASSTGEVETVIKKLAWLRTWRKHNSPALESLSGKSYYHWLATGGAIAITRRSKYYRALAQNKIIGPQRILTL